MFASLLRLLFPEHCRGCQTPGHALCPQCISRIPPAMQLPHETYAVFDYGHPLVRWTIRDLKYNRKSESARALVDGAIPHILHHLPRNTPIILVPIPGHTAKKRLRGFNQSELIALWLARGIRNASVDHILRKTVFTLPQAHLKRHERLTNVMHTMQSTRQLDTSLTYVVIDDVSTTGSTFVEARRALQAAGAIHIYCVAIAHGYATNQK